MPTAPSPKIVRRSRFRPRRKKRIAILATLVVVALIRLWQTSSDSNAPLSEGIYEVERVVDGDTLLLDNGHRVRLIGVNTPETVAPGRAVEPWGPEASEFTKVFINFAPVRLQFDTERLDQHGRMLAYVWSGDRLLNEELIRAGLGRYEPDFHYSATMKRRFSRAQDEARAASRGIWSGQTP